MRGRDQALQGRNTVRHSYHNYKLIYNAILLQVNPSPSKGGLQVHVKLAFNTLSLAHTALASHGPEKQGSGTVDRIFDKCAVQYY